MSEQYVQRRLAWASRATELPASVQFDLALDENFDDDSLDEVASTFGASQDSGWGLSEVFDSLMSREPQRQEVEDLTAYQQNLIDNGYAPAGTVATGTWDPFWNGAARRAERDAYSARIGGETPVSTPFATAFQFLGNVMPSKVFQGIVGMAKGVVEQAPETIARGGLLGGAATGAAIGAVAGGPVGALIGGALGGVGGFFGDLLTDQEGEEDTSGLERLWDALTPYEEYTGKAGAQQFFEDLGFVASAAALVSGAKMAVGGVQAGLAAGAERGLLTKAATSQPGLLAKGLTGAKGSAAIGAAIGGGVTFTETHDLSDALKGALAGGIGGYGLSRFLPGFGQGVAKVSAAHGLGAQASRPLIQTINGAFSGVSRAQLTGRMAGALGDDSKIEQEIQAQDLHHSGVRDAIDNTLGWIINPNGFFAFEGSKVADGFGKLLGSEANLAYDLIATEVKANGSVSSFARRAQEIAEKLSPRSVQAGRGVDPLELRANDFRLRVFFGIDMKTANDARLLERDLGTVDFMRERAKLRARNKRDVLEEWRKFEEGEISATPLTEDLMTWSYGVAGDKEKGPTRFYAWLKGQEGKGSSLDRLGIQVTAEDVAEDLTRAVQEERIPVAFEGETLSVGATPLYHVTSPEGASGIRSGGFKVGESGGFGSGDYGPGVYLTDEHGLDWWRSQFSEMEETGRRASEVIETTPDISKTLRISTVSDAGTTRRPRAQLEEADSKLIGRFDELVSGGVSETEALGQTVREAGYSGIAREGRGGSLQEVVMFDPKKVPLAGAPPVKVRGGKPASKTTDPRAEELRNQAKILTKEIKRDQDELLNAPDPVAAAKAIETKKLEVKRLRKEAKSIPTIDARREVTFTVANLDNAELGINATPTMQMAERLSQRVSELAETLKGSQREFQKALSKGEQHAIDGLREQFGTTRDELVALVNDLQKRELISHKQWEKAMDVLEKSKTRSGAVQKGAPLEQIAAHLDEVKTVFGREVDLPPEIAARLPEGKTLIATGEDMIFSKDITHNLAAKNVDLFNQAPNWVESLKHGFKVMGVDPALHSNTSIFYARAANQAAEVHQVLAGADIPLQGKRAMELLRKAMDDLNHGDGVIHNGVKMHSSAMGFPPVVRRIRTAAGGETKAEIGMYIADPRELSIGQIQEYLHLDELAGEGVDPYQLAGKVFHALKKGAALGADTAQMSLQHPMTGFRMVAKSMQVDGLPGFVEYMRTFHITNPTRTGAVGGALVGAEVEREKGGSLTDIATGAAIGAAGGGGLGRGVKSRQREVKGSFNNLLKLKFPKDSYGYLPDQLHRLSMAARYTFSFAFDLGRHWEQAVMGLTRENIPMFFRPQHYIENTYGTGAWEEALKLHDSMRGGIEMQQIEEVDRRLFQAGIAGYSPRKSEAARAFILKQEHPNMSLKEIEARVTALEGYGIGRRNIEKSINFVFFPYSFSKKLLTSLGDFVLQEPGRALMIHEGFRRMNGLDEDFKNGDEDSFGAQFGEWLTKNVPMAQQLSRLNNLAYGIGPGRFLGQGLKDHPTDLGKAFQILTSVFVPSGANTPIAQMFGGMGDAAVHFFSPVVITDDPNAPTRGRELAWKETLDTIDAFIPAIRDLTNFATSLDRQTKAVLGGGDPFWQAQHYNDERKSDEIEIAPMAQALGYSSVQGFLASDVGAAVKAAYDQRELERQAKYPIGYEQNQSFVNNDGLNEKALGDLATKEDKTTAEQEILRIRAMEFQLEQMSPVLGIGPEELKLTYQPQIREQAAAFADDREFVMLWDRFFASTFGPISRAVA